MYVPSCLTCHVPLLYLSCFRVLVCALFLLAVTLSRDKVIDTITECGQDRWSEFGSKLRINPAEISALTFSMPRCVGKLDAIIQKAVARDGQKKTVNALRDICEDLEILGLVKDELHVEGELLICCNSIYMYMKRE